MLRIAIAVNERDHTLTPFIVSLFTWSKAYHVELIFSDGVSITADPEGVRYVTRSFDPWKWVILPVPDVTPEHEACIRKLADKIVSHKCKYDWLGAIFGAFLGSSFNDVSRWYCSELVAYLLRDTEIFKHTTITHQFTPSDIWHAAADYLIESAKNHGYTSYFFAPSTDAADRGKISDNESTNITENNNTSTT